MIDLIYSKKVNKIIFCLFLISSIQVTHADEINGGKEIAGASDSIINFGDSQWKYVVIKDGTYWNKKYPRIYINNRYNRIEINTPFETQAYIEKEFDIPKRGSFFSIRANTFSNHATGTIYLIDSKNTRHFLGVVPNQYQMSKMDELNFDISSYSGQKAMIRIHQTSAPDGAGWGYYSGMGVKVRGYTLIEYFVFSVVYPIIYMSVFSLIIGLLMGFSGLEFINSLINKFHLWISKKYNFCLNNEKWYIRYYLKFAFSITNRSFQLADKIQNPKLRTGIKSALMIDLPIIFIYLTLLIIYIIISIVIAIVILAIIIWIIISLLGGSPSGGSIGGGGGSSGSSNSSSKDGYYEKDGKKYDIKTEERIIKQDGRTYRDGFFGWNADKDFFGDDEVERDFFGDPKIEKDFFGDQKIEKDFFGDPIVPPKKKK